MSMVCECIRFCGWETMLLAILLSVFTIYVGTMTTLLRLVAKAPERGRRGVRKMESTIYMYVCELKGVRTTSLPDMHTIR